MSKKFPRYDSLTNEGMFEGFCIDGGMYYASSEESLLCILREEFGANYINDDQAILDRYYEREVYEWTSWEDIPEDEWDCPPKKGMSKIQRNAMLTLMSRSKFLLRKYDNSLELERDGLVLDTQRKEVMQKIHKLDSLFMKIFDSLQQ